MILWHGFRSSVATGILVPLEGVKCDHCLCALIVLVHVGALDRSLNIFELHESKEKEAMLSTLVPSLLVIVIPFPPFVIVVLLQTFYFSVGYLFEHGYYCRRVGAFVHSRLRRDRVLDDPLLDRLHRGGRGPRSVALQGVANQVCDRPEVLGLHI
jgi:hypothetical protein